MGPNTQEQASSPDARWDHAPGEGDGDDEDEEDQDADAEAEEIARRLNDQLWAEISKAQAEAAAATTKVTSAATTSSTTISHSHSVPVRDGDRRVQEALKTMRIILKDVGNDPLARSTLSTAVIPGMRGLSVLDALNAAVASNAISKRVARPLSHLLVSLAHSEVLFSSLRHHHRSEQPSIELVELGKKRRRDQPGDDDAPPPKRLFSLPVPAAVPPPPPLLPPMPYALHTQLDGASRAIISALTGPAAPPTGPPPPPLIASIQFPLHQVFLFAMTTAGPARNALQELGGLIQALGILSGVPIGGGSSGPGSAAATTTPWGHPGTAVYPCSFPGCGKTFARLYSLRAHTRVHSAERPFRCTRCPAAFARNHDLKRHERLHEDKAWQCTGCAKAFSRRDALTRHRNTSAARHTACANADVAEIEVPRGGTATGSGSASGAGAGAGAAEDEQLRRTRVWHEASDVAAAAPGSILEEGELPRPVLAAAHEAVARLHPVLQACVIRASSSAPLVAADAGGVDVAASQATLASALARVQAQLTAGNSIVTPSASAAPAPATATTATAGEGGVPPAYASSSSVAPPGSSLYGLSPEQTQMLEQAIASAASAAQLQAEAEAALEEEEEGEEVSSEGEDKDMEGQ